MPTTVAAVGSVEVAASVFRGFAAVRMQGMPFVEFDTFVVASPAVEVHLDRVAHSGRTC